MREVNKMDRDRLERTLHELGSLPVADADEISVARIAARWREAASARATAGRQTTASKRPLRRPAVVGSAVLVGVAASVALIVVVQDPAPQTALVVAYSQGVTVRLPDGEVLTPLAGEELPDGAIVEAGTGAKGLFGSDVIAPLSRYVVVDGRLQLQASSEPSDTEAPQPGTTTTSAQRPSTSVAPAGNPTGSTLPSTSSPQATAATPTSSALPPKRVPPARLAVSAGRKGNKIVISWAPFGGPGVKRYEVIRVRSWNGNTLPKGKKIATVNRNKATTATDGRPQAGTFYVVAALGAKGKVLAIGSVRAPNPATP
ncbi:unannotated protein [freshwater metagenome]|uniref:Unannotated protein n=1 Tax=freshwater metagenome TaxID=449393 RepID=A0A6J6YJW4_9ZZZZ